MKYRHFLWIVAIPVFLQLLNLFCLHFNHHFHAKDFAHGFHPSYSREVCGLDFAKLEPILNQPFHYLGNGKQMVALESADGRYVLKLFNPMRPLKKNWFKKWKNWQRYSSLKWIKREWFQKKIRLRKLFDRHKVAFENMQDESGLIFVHLSPSTHIQQKIQVTDDTGKIHQLSLATTPFVLQEKATLVPFYLNDLMNQGKIEKAKEAIHRMQYLFEKRIEVGITDRIQTMENNYGFVGEKPIQIDVGRIRPLQLDSLDEKQRVFGAFHDWLKSHYRELL